MRLNSTLFSWVACCSLSSPAVMLLLSAILAQHVGRARRASCKCRGEYVLTACCCQSACLSLYVSVLLPVGLGLNLSAHRSAGSPETGTGALTPLAGAGLRRASQTCCWIPDAHR